EVCIEDAKQLLGVGQAHNRTPKAVERTVPFGLACQTLAVCWYATTGHHPDDVTDHRARRPWYRTKTNPSTADMHAKLRRVLIATRYRPARPHQPTPRPPPPNTPPRPPNPPPPTKTPPHPLARGPHTRKTANLEIHLPARNPALAPMPPVPPQRGLPPPRRPRHRRDHHRRPAAG